MKLDIYDDLVFINGMESANEGKGECQETIVLLNKRISRERDYVHHLRLAMPQDIF
jgi:hypothetical protein